MQADLPHTLYKRNGKDKVSEADVDEATRLTMEAYERKKRRQAEEGYTLEEVFNGKVDADSEQENN